MTFVLLVDVVVTTGDESVVLVTVLVLVLVLVVVTGFDLAFVDGVSDSELLTGDVLSAGFGLFGTGAGSSCVMAGVCGGDCTMTGFSITGTGILVFGTASGVVCTDGLSSTLFVFGTADSAGFCTIFGAGGTTMTGFGIEIEFFENELDCETGLNNPSALIRILGSDDETLFPDDEPAVEVFLLGDL